MIILQINRFSVQDLPTSENSILMSETCRFELDPFWLKYTIPKGSNGGFTKDQNIPANKIPWHPPGIRIKTLLTNSTKMEAYAEKFNVGLEILQTDCLHKTLPELKMVRLVKESQIADGTIITQDCQGSRGKRSVKLESDSTQFTDADLDKYLTDEHAIWTFDSPV